MYARDPQLISCPGTESRTFRNGHNNLGYTTVSNAGAPTTYPTTTHHRHHQQSATFFVGHASCMNVNASCHPLLGPFAPPNPTRPHAARRLPPPPPCQPLPRHHRVTLDGQNPVPIQGAGWWCYHRVYHCHATSTFQSTRHGPNNPAPRNPFFPLGPQRARYHSCLRHRQACRTAHSAPRPRLPPSLPPGLERQGTHLGPAAAARLCSPPWSPSAASRLPPPAGPGHYRPSTPRPTSSKVPLQHRRFHACSSYSGRGFTPWPRHDPPPVPPPAPRVCPGAIRCRLPRAKRLPGTSRCPPSCTCSSRPGE